ncbi:MAG: type II/IV secretion system ATPase subunit [Candidatus Hydrothermarchaeales archaeon]
MPDCKKYIEEIKKLEEKLEGLEEFKDVLTVDKDEIAGLKERIRSTLNSNIGEELLECLTYKKVGIGSLTPFMFDDDLEEVMVIGAENPVYTFSRSTGMIVTDVVMDKDELDDVVKKMAGFSGRIINAEQPLLDGRLPDGSRVNATLHAVTPRGSTITIRKFKREPLTIIDLIKFNTMNSMVAAFLWLAVEGLGTKASNILMVGGTASGKTSTLNAASIFIPRKDRILTIEDTLEIQLLHSHWVPMETKPPDPGSHHEITMDDLLKNVLRMRPDRIMVGEVRASEALTLFTAMNTGHEGCMATLHANSAREALSRLQSPPMSVPDIMIPALDLLIVQTRQMEEGKLVRRISEIAEVSGKEGDTFLMNTLFEYNPKSREIETKILNGKIVKELSDLSALSVKEIDEEIDKRRVILETMADANLGQSETYDIVQTYYEDPDKALEKLSQSVTS